MKKISNIFLVFFVVFLCGCEDGHKAKEAKFKAAFESEASRLYIKEWVRLNILERTSADGAFEYQGANGIGMYLVKSEFDWGRIGLQGEGRSVKLLGDLSAPRAVVFHSFGRYSVIYNFSGEEILGIDSIHAEELKLISNGFYYFSRLRG
jgi:hypothetical protein